MGHCLFEPCPPRVFGAVGAPEGSPLKGVGPFSADAAGGLGQERGWSVTVLSVWSVGSSILLHHYLHHNPAHHLDFTTSTNKSLVPIGTRLLGRNAPRGATRSMVASQPDRSFQFIGRAACSSVLCGSVQCRAQGSNQWVEWTLRFSLNWAVILPRLVASRPKPTEPWTGQEQERHTQHEADDRSRLSGFIEKPHT